MASTTTYSPLFLLSLTIYGLAFYNCFKVVGSRTSPGGAFAWILINLLVPWIGVPLYLLLGEFRIKGYVKRHRAGAKELDQNGALILPSPPPEETALVAPLRGGYTSFRTVLSRFGTVFEPQYANVELLVDGKQTFTEIFAAIASAKRYIVVQYYILRHDRLGLELGRLLSNKARAGVAVYMLYDDLGSLWLSRDYIRDLRESGVKVERFLPIANFKRFFQMNFRNHRKLVVVDGEVAFTGGLNVGEEYAAPRSRKARSRYWRDTHVRITGGAVLQLQEVFFEDWYFATEEKVEVPEAAVATANPLRTAPTNATSVVQLVPTGPADDALVSLLFILHLINSATRRLWIASPYFVPDATIMHALELAALRGVDVRVMLPRRSDNMLVHWVSLAYGELLLLHGVKVMLYISGFMHQKVILVDDTIGVVGTMNMDNRAVYLNFETMVLVHGLTFNSQIAAMLENDFQTCRLLQPETQGIRRVLKRARANFARLLAPLL